MSQSTTRQLILEARARSMRHHPTASEHRLWQALSGGRARFRRQVVIGEHIVDFAAKQRRLIVEVDGGYHDARVRADARRDRALRRAGYRVLRLPAALVMADLAAAVECVREALPR